MVLDYERLDVDRSILEFDGPHPVIPVSGSVYDIVSVDARRRVPDDCGQDLRSPAVSRSTQRANPPSALLVYLETGCAVSAGGSLLPLHGPLSNVPVCGYCV